MLLIVLFKNGETVESGELSSKKMSSAMMLNPRHILMA